MFEENQTITQKKGWAISALIIAVLSVVLVIVGRLVNMSSSRAVYSNETEAIQHISTGLTIAVAFLSLLGLIFSVIALIRAFRRPQVYGGKAISITALVINDILSLFSVAVVLILVSYLFGK